MHSDRFAAGALIGVGLQMPIDHVGVEVLTHSGIGDA